MRKKRWQKSGKKLALVERWLIMFLTTLYLSLALVAFLALIFVITVMASMVTLFFTKVPFVPTPKKNVKIIIDSLDLKSGQVFYDLGCGDGRFLIATAKTGANAIGFEISPWAYAKARLNIFLAKSPAKVYFKNFYETNLKDASAIFCFLLDRVMPKVEKKLKKELKPGAKIICYGFPLPTWPAKKIIELNPSNKKSSKIYLYKM